MKFHSRIIDIISIINIISIISIVPAPTYASFPGEFETGIFFEDLCVFVFLKNELFIASPNEVGRV